MNGWKLDRNNLNINLKGLQADMRGFSDKYGLNVRIKGSNDVNVATGQVEPKLTLEVNLTAIGGVLSGNAKKDFDGLQKRFDDLKAESQSLQAEKVQLDKSADDLRKVKADLDARWQALKKKVGDKNYQNGMSGGGGQISFDLEYPPDPPPGTEQEVLDLDRLN